MDRSAEKLAPFRTIEVRKNHQGPGFLLVAVESRPDSGLKQTLLNVGHPIIDKAYAKCAAQHVSRCVEALTGVVYGYQA